MRWLNKGEPSSWLRYVLVPLLVGLLGLIPWLGNWIFNKRYEPASPAFVSGPPDIPPARPVPEKEYLVEWTLTPLGQRFRTMDVPFHDLVTRKKKQPPMRTRDFLCNAGWHLNPQLSPSYEVEEEICEPRKGKERICRSRWSHGRREDNAGIRLEYFLPDSDGKIGVRGALHCVQPIDGDGPKRSGTLRIKAGQTKTIEYGEGVDALAQTGLVQGASRGYKAELRLEGNSLILTDTIPRGTLGPVLFALDHLGIIKVQIP